ncbi:MAG: hypothetical protein OXL38_14305 [Gammaproteobacteria bacterium]|nr:hypothetical protein [Gammaproteobacteria bacterium]MDE0443279.1 hypothetical protein [Gammaproteobacteria bacterium]
MNPQIVIALYKPHEGKDADLRALIDQHVPTLRKLELITDRPALLARSRKVARIWEAMEQVADLPSLDSLKEASRTFPHFEPVR